MKTKYKVLLLVISILLTMSLLMTLSFAYIRKSNLSTKVYNSNFGLVNANPYSFTVANQVNSTIALDSTAFATGSIGSEVINKNGNFNITLTANKRTVYCYYNIYFEALSDFNLTNSTETEFTMTIKKYESSSTTALATNVKMSSMKAGERKYLTYDTSIYASSASKTVRIYYYFGFYSISANQQALTNSQITGYVGAEQDYCEEVS